MPIEKVLTNWERLNNAPLLLPNASAVQWNEYIFVLASDGTTLLYQTKLKLWSMLPSCTFSLKQNIPLVNYKGKILTVSNSFKLITFDVSSSSWKEATFNPPGEVSNIAVNGDTLYAKVKNRTNGQAYSYGRSKIISRIYQYILFSLTTGEWKEHSEINEVKEWNSKFFQISDYLFEQTASKIYRHKLTDLNSKPLQEITAPLYKDSTLYTIKDALHSFGGRDEDHQPTSDVLRYNPDTDTWESAGYMRSARYNVAVTTTQQGDTTEVYVLGGELGRSALIMQPKLNIVSNKLIEDKAPVYWNCSTSIVEKCTLFD